MAAKRTFKNPLYGKNDIKRFSGSVSSKKNPEPFRTEYRRDYGRVLHCPSFRRLQGKTQLFPNDENDFYRNRLTHSLEVAQIAKSIAMKINYGLSEKNQIDLDIVELAAVSHDIGHPPFGHNGETSLDESMRHTNGGFEGNAQTFRVLARLEKKVTDSTVAASGTPISSGQDKRRGLDLTARSLASVLKYDNRIPDRDKDRGKRKGKVVKGYYDADKDIVDFVKESVLGIPASQIARRGIKFKTLECQIMDIADDIAYSTYDLEDAFKAGFLNPLKLVSFPNDFYQEIAAEIEEQLSEQYDPKKWAKDHLRYSAADLVVTITQLFERIFEVESGPPFAVAAKISFHSEELARNGYLRTSFTSDLVGMFISGVQFEPNDEFPALSKVYLSPDVFKIVETLKKISYKSLIMSPMLKVTEYRGKDILKRIFDTLCDGDGAGAMFMPHDYGGLHTALNSDAEKQRVVCDYIAGMTDRYALDFYDRLFGTKPQTIHKPF